MEPQLGGGSVISKLLGIASGRLGLLIYGVATLRYSIGAGRCGGVLPIVSMIRMDWIHSIRGSGNTTTHFVFLFQIAGYRVAIAMKLHTATEYLHSIYQ